MRKNLTLERLYLLGTKPTSLGSSLVIHDIETDRMAFAGDKSYKFSALSALDGRVFAYHGING